jgi:DNA replication ATP-dependent helicase Dna2
VATMADEIVNALENELDATSRKPPRFEVLSRERHDAAWVLHVRPAEDDYATLDPELEGCTAWWIEDEVKVAADVLAVDPDAARITIRFLTGPPPTPGTLFLVFPQRFLEALKDCWSQPVWAAECERWRARTRRPEGAEAEAAALEPLDVPGTKSLRRAQRQALSLAHEAAGVLWGPPGTGKTFTLGALVARFLVQNPGSRVLLLAPTNSATDHLIVSVDEALERWTPDQRPIREKLKRVGSHFRAKTFERRRHLLPANEDQHLLVEELAQKEASQPERSRPSYLAWKQEVEELRKRLRVRIADVIPDARLVACTTTAAAFVFTHLRAVAPFDLIVIDEASQVSRAYAYGLAPLGRHVVFAGDPMQLSPIARAKDVLTTRWIATSILDAEDRRAFGHECKLDEQSRMAEPICSVISSIFYSGNLRVAGDCATDPGWLAHRALRPTPTLGADAVRIVPVTDVGGFAAGLRGFVRHESVRLVVQIVGEVLAVTPASDVLVLTPFRAQRRLIERELRAAGHRRVGVSTIHRAQGSERHTVIVDPVNASVPFVDSEEGRRLLNVAMSRAQARLVLLLAPGDHKNQVFVKVRNMLEVIRRGDEPPSLTLDVTLDRSFPAHLERQMVAVAATRGVVISARYPYLVLATLDAEKRFRFRAPVAAASPSPTIVVAGAAARFVAHRKFVHDHERRISWQIEVARRLFSFADARRYAATLDLLSGRWRLPTLDELETLVAPGARPSIDPRLFPGTPTEWFWSSTVDQRRAGQIQYLGISFFNGRPSNKDPQGRAYVRCVSDQDFGASSPPARRGR